MTRKITLLDGGMGQELLARSSIKKPKFWSAQYLISEPDLVREIHCDYIRAGARVITLNTYSATYTRLAIADAAKRVGELQRLACDLAHRARDDAGAAGADVAIAGCLPPLNGSYRADRVRPYDVNLDEYRRLVAHQAPHVDLFICETMSTIEEARAAATAVTESGKPVWVGLAIVDGGGSAMRSGEAVSDAATALSGHALDALLINCSEPESIVAAMPELAATGYRVGAYANGFTGIPDDFVPGVTIERLSARRDLGPEAYERFVMQWIDDGASIVGGCCEVGPAHIKRLHDTLAGQVFEITNSLAA